LGLTLLLNHTQLKATGGLMPSMLPVGILPGRDAAVLRPYNFAW